MPPDTLKWPQNIVDCATHISETTRLINRAHFDRDMTLRRAVERSFEIIGEAIIRISRVDPAWASKLTSRQRIIGFRNILVHAYDNIDTEIVWDIIQRHLPQLMNEVRLLIDEQEKR